MIRKTVSFLLIFTFISLAIGVNSSFALRQVYDTYNFDPYFKQPSYDTYYFVAGGVVLVGIILLLVSKSKGTSSPSEPIKDQPQASQQSDSNIDDRLTSSGELVLLKW